MPDFDSKTLDWMRRAKRREKPYSHLTDDRGLLEFLSATGEISDGQFVVKTGFTKNGDLKWKIVNRSIRLPRKPRLCAKFEFGFASWDQQDFKARYGEPDFGVELQRASKDDKAFYPVKEATCGFIVQGHGEECAITEIVFNGQKLTDNLQSQFYCQQPSPIDQQPTAPTAMTSSLMAEEKVLQAHELKGHVDFGIITIRDEEHKAVLRRFPNRKLVKGNRVLCDFAELKTDDGKLAKIIIARCLEPGQGPARDLAEAILDELDPKWWLLVGIAGGFPAFEYWLGDVVLSSRLLDFTVWAALEGKTAEFNVSGGSFHGDVVRLLQYLPGKKLGNWNTKSAIKHQKPSLELPPSANHEAFYGDDSWKQKVHECLTHHIKKRAKKKENGLPCFHIGPTISSDAVLKDTNIAESLRKAARSAENIEMELAAIYRAVLSRKDHLPRIIGIRGISDIIGYNRQHDWLEYACQTPASFAHAFIKSGVVNLVGSENRVA